MEQVAAHIINRLTTPDTMQHASTHTATLTVATQADRLLKKHALETLHHSVNFLSSQKTPPYTIRALQPPMQVLHACNQAGARCACREQKTQLHPMHCMKHCGRGVIALSNYQQLILNIARGLAIDMMPFEKRLNTSESSTMARIRWAEMP